ncbi:MAG: membrane dipeptidase [Acutalibacteraceae bacterium]|nr:membrane dipeptidase [Acutalibacteraceae bacterium]
MNYFDLHCDTLSRCVQKNEVVEKNTGCVDVERLSAFDKCYQVYAAFIRDDISPADALTSFNRQYSLYKFSDFKNTGHILSVENASLLDYSLYRLCYLRECGVQILTLTWNGENCLGGGADTNIGLSDFGKTVIKECERLGIIVDLSHLSDKSFYDAMSIISKPPIASHSNCRAVCNHRRNLTNEQLQNIFAAGGIVGLNLHCDFVGDKLFPGNILKHIEHLLTLGGENSIALGTDFDGCSPIKDVENIEKMPKFYEILCENLGISLANKIFYENAKIFFDKRSFLL